MQEEFHGETYADGTYKRKLLYGWNTLNANVWLPSLSELVGVTGTQNTGNGCYFPAMQGLNISSGNSVDKNGGSQFTYFQQYNASGGGQIIWNICNQERSWLRSPDYGNATDSWRTTDAQNLNAPIATGSHAVHPAV